MRDAALTRFLHEREEMDAALRVAVSEALEARPDATPEARAATALLVAQEWGLDDHVDDPPTERLFEAMLTLARDDGLGRVGSFTPGSGYPSPGRLVGALVLGLQRDGAAAVATDELLRQLGAPLEGRT